MRLGPVANGEVPTVRTRHLDAVNRPEQQMLGCFSPPCALAPGVEVWEHPKGHSAGSHSSGHGPHGLVQSVVFQDEHVGPGLGKFREWDAEPKSAKATVRDVTGRESPFAFVHIPAAVGLADLTEPHFELDGAGVSDGIESGHRIRSWLLEPVDDPRA